MIVALSIGRKESKGFPGKNTYPVLGRPLMAYSLMAAQNSSYVDDIYISTDSSAIAKTAERYGAKIIRRPRFLASDTALGEDCFVHGYRQIKKSGKKTIEFMVLIFCNAPTVLSRMIDEGIEFLRRNPKFDSAVSVSRYNMWSPSRARKIAGDGCLKPVVSCESFRHTAKITCDRDSQGDIWFADGGVSVVRPRCLEDMQ